MYICMRLMGVLCLNHDSVIRVCGSDEETSLSAEYLVV